MDKSFINGFFETLRDIRAGATPELKRQFDQSLEIFCKSVLDRELKKPGSRAHLSEEERERLRAQDRERQNRRRAKMTPEERAEMQTANAKNMVKVRAGKKDGGLSGP